MNPNEPEAPDQIPEAPMFASSERQISGGGGWRVFAGLLLAGALDASVVGFVAVLEPSGGDQMPALYLLLGIGLAQWIWLLPVYFFLKRRGYENVQKGVLIGGSMITLLNAACWTMLAAVK